MYWTRLHELLNKNFANHRRLASSSAWFSQFTYRYDRRERRPWLHLGCHPTGPPAAALLVDANRMKIARLRGSFSRLASCLQQTSESGLLPTTNSTHGPNPRFLPNDLHIAAGHGDAEKWRADGGGGRSGAIAAALEMFLPSCGPPVMNSDRCRPGCTPSSRSEPCQPSVWRPSMCARPCRPSATRPMRWPWRISHGPAGTPSPYQDGELLRLRLLLTQRRTLKRLQYGSATLWPMCADR